MGDGECMREKETRRIETERERNEQQNQSESKLTFATFHQHITYKLNT